MRQAPRLLSALVATAVLTLTAACDPEDLPTPGETTVDVDTPALRKAKRAAGVEDCVPGVRSPVEGGLPELTLPCFGGGPDVDLSSLRGPMVVNIWGTWCGPCRREMPILARFHERHGDQVPVLGLDYEDVQTAAAMDLVAESGVRYPLVADPGGELAGKPPFPGRMGLPITVFVDAGGQATVVPVVLDSERELVDLVWQHLGIRL